VLVLRGSDPPYAVDENKIYVHGGGNSLAVRDEIVGLVRRGVSIFRKSRFLPNLPLSKPSKAPPKRSDTRPRSPSSRLPGRG
jgi:hypothetical protein